MKFFATALFLASSAISASAFSAVAPKANGAATGSPEPIDKSLKGIDAEGSFDPVEGENAALSRNNNGEVWVQQVRITIST